MSVSVLVLAGTLASSTAGLTGSTGSTGAPNRPPAWGELDPGPFRAGFERLERRDYSRPYREGATEPEERARPIPMSVWYPATEAASPDEVEVAFGEYVDEGSDTERLAARIASYGFSSGGDVMEKLLAQPTAAVEKAARAKGPFPLLVLGTALTGPSYLHTVLCEYLATHGYVVVSIPSLPVREGREADFDGLSVDAQMRDMEFVLQEMHDYPEADTAHVGLVAWSFGGVPQALLSMKNPDVAAVVSLDAATGYAYGQKLLESSLFFEPERATAPFLHVTDSRESDKVEKSFRYFDQVVRGPAYFLTIAGMTHAQFTSLGSVVPAADAHLSSDGDGDGGETKDLFRRYRLLCLYVRNFLDEQIKKDEDARKFLDVAPTRHGFEGLVLSRRR